MNKRIFILILIVVIFSTGASLGAEPQYVPLDNQSMGLLMQRILETKLIPYTKTNKGLSYTINELQEFAMDWEQECFFIKVKFTAEYDPGFFNVSTAGVIKVKGAGLLSASEQKLGVKLLEVQEVTLDNADELINEPLQKVLNKSLAGKEIWQGDPPAAKELLNKNNYLDLVKIAIANSLPITANDKKLSLTLNLINELSQAGTVPGQMKAGFDMNGTYKSLLKLNFKGKMGLEVDVLVDPAELAGKIRIDSLSSLDLKNVPSFMDGLIRKLVDSKIKGKVMEFTWK